MKHYEPGSMGCHEVLHMASFLADAIEEQLIDHPAIQQNVEWVIKAKVAHDAILALYQEIGNLHLRKQR